MSDPVTFLFDNGSLEPAATLGLRRLATQLGEHLGQRVEAVSLLHSSGVPAEKLNGLAAEIVEPALERRLRTGKNDFLLLPLFFGPSGALTDYLPARLAHLQAKHPELRAKIASPLFRDDDDRLARILRDRVHALGGSARRVALVDHGSPARAVTAVRDALAQQLAGLLGAEYTVAAASMERREDPAYDFCDPLLARLLRQPAWNAGEVIVAMQFLLPGRHAGANGDVATICREAEAASDGRLHTTMSGLVAGHPLLIDILADRWQAATRSRA